MFNWLKRLILNTTYQKRVNTVYVRFHPKKRMLIFSEPNKLNSFEAPELDFIKEEILSKLDLDYLFWFINKNKKSEKWGSIKYALDYEVTWDYKILLDPSKFREVKVNQKTF